MLPPSPPDPVEVLIAKHGRKVRGIAARIVGHDDAEDVAQLVWLSVWRHLASFRGEAQPSSWLHRIAINQSLSWLRGRRRQPFPHRLPDTDGETSVPLELVDFAPTPEALVIAAREWDDALGWMYTHLPPQVVNAVLRNAEGDRPGEIAAELEVPIGTIKSRLHRARRQLRERRDRGRI